MNNMCDCLTAQCKVCQMRINDEGSIPVSLTDHKCFIDAMVKVYEDIIMNNPVVNESEAMLKACENNHVDHDLQTTKISQQALMYELQKIMRLQMSDWLDFSQPISDMSLEDSQPIYCAFDDARKFFKEFNVQRLIQNGILKVNDNNPEEQTLLKIAHKMPKYNTNNKANDLIMVKFHGVDLGNNLLIGA